MSNRKSTKGRVSVIRRDNYACRKCAYKDSLQVHHIQAVMDGGKDDLDNLITLCSPCHREWELAETCLNISFEDWLPLPPYKTLVLSFISQATAHQEVKISDVHDATMLAHNILTDIRRLEALDAREEKKGKGAK